MFLASNVLYAQAIKQLDVNSFEKKKTELKEFTLLDVRTQDEYAQGHLANSTLLDIYSNEFKTKAAKLDKSKPVLVYCASGIRSKKAAVILEELGFKEIYNLSGGFAAWKQMNKPIVK
jgi:rhodanese-related sulfurtransferase